MESTTTTGWKIFGFCALVVIDSQILGEIKINEGVYPNWQQGVGLDPTSFTLMWVRIPPRLLRIQKWLAKFAVLN